MRQGHVPRRGPHIGRYRRRRGNPLGYEGGGGGVPAGDESRRGIPLGSPPAETARRYVPDFGMVRGRQGGVLRATGLSFLRGCGYGEKPATPGSSSGGRVPFVHMDLRVTGGPTYA